ncbi:MAG: ABC transporter permease [Planctomycetaceae bacterium]|nr:ABC transporter permease [Planctomycetaceae bacterium]
MFSIILRGLWHYRRLNIVVMLAVAISTAVIGGSLIVGDSVRSSLQQMTLQRLGGLTHVLHSPRFFTEEQVQRVGRLLAESDRFGVDGMVVTSGMLLTGSVEYRGENAIPTSETSIRRAGSAVILGVTDDLWSMLLHGDAAIPTDRGIVLGARTAKELHASVGDDVSVWIERPSAIPRDSLLGEREDVNLELVLTVESILAEDDGASRFSLNPGQQLPYNAFLSLSALQSRLELDEREASRRNPVARPARVNALFAGQRIRGSQTSIESVHSVADPAILNADLRHRDVIQDVFHSELSLADIGVVFRNVPEKGYLSVESDSMILEDGIAGPVLDAAKSLGTNAQPTLVYLANEIRRAVGTESENQASTSGQMPGYSMYSIIAGLNFDQPSPLGPFQLTGGQPLPALTDDQIILSQWLARDLEIQVGDSVQARWHEVGSHGDLPETHHQFEVVGILDAEDPVSIDQHLTPFVEGVTNVDSFSDWDQPFDMEMDRITSRDDDYWAERRATPKAFLSLASAEKFWKSRFGSYTSIRVAGKNGPMPEEALRSLQSQLKAATLERLQPERLGFIVQPIRVTGLQASVGANDFTQLFLGFSFFLILSAVLLAGLMFRLGIQQRVAQIGLLEAIGFTPGRARKVFLGEGLVVSLAGSILGSLIAVAFGKLMVYGLTHWWIGAIGTQFLRLDVQEKSLVIAAAISLLLAVIVIWRSLVVCTRRPPRELLMGETGENVVVIPSAFRSVLNLVLRTGTILTAVGLPSLLLAGLIPSTEAFGGMSWRVVCFFIAGFACLATGLMILSGRLRRRTGERVRGRTAGGILRLAIANAARSPQRSLLTTALIAFATFVIVAVGAGRRNPTVETPDRASGNGGFTLVAEASQPILFDLNSPDGRRSLMLDDSPEASLPDSVNIFGFSMQAGQDASCLNLYQTSVPTMLGASERFLQRGGFRFADTPGENPWLQLNESFDDTLIPAEQSSGQDSELNIPTIPVIGDMNTLQFSLKKGIGDSILFPNAIAPQFALRIVGMLDSSVFQGVVVMSDANLKRIVPDISGSRYFLIETYPDVAAISSVAAVLETGLNAFGVDTEPVSQRLAGFLAVQNTYLSTFQMLGGLGLLVGTFGLTAVMMRNVIERRSEIALLKALGFTNIRVTLLILVENSVLLVWGIITGTTSALLAMLPHLRTTGADAPWIPLGLTLLAVLVVGTFAVIFPVRAAVQTPIRETLAGG